MNQKYVLHIDSSARSGYSDTDRHGSHTRRLSRQFMQQWQSLRPDDHVTYRDVGNEPPAPVSGDWIAAAFTPPHLRDEAMQAILEDSDCLTRELVEADLLVVGMPMYNFGVPAPLKAWIDNVVRVGITFGFDRSRNSEPYWPMLSPGKRLIILTSRGDYGYAPGERLASMNHAETGLKTPLAYLGLTESETIAIEYDEFGDERLQASIMSAEVEVNRLAKETAALFELHAFDHFA